MAYMLMPRLQSHNHHTWTNEHVSVFLIFTTTAATCCGFWYVERPSCAQTLRLAFFVNVLGARLHPIRSPLAGVPATRRLTDHPHPQHPHLPPHPYLSHPAFYSPIPHPSTLYPDSLRCVTPETRGVRVRRIIRGISRERWIALLDFKYLIP
jgi:hypothetical protein